MKAMILLFGFISLVLTGKITEETFNNKLELILAYYYIKYNCINYIIYAQSARAINVFIGSSSMIKIFLIEFKEKC